MPNQRTTERVLVVGLGSAGRRHLTNLRHLLPEAQLVALPARGGQRDDLTGHADRVCVTLDEALAFEPQIAVVASPSSHHLRFAEPLAKAGAHLLVEKPLAESVQSAREIEAVCEKRSVLLGVAYMLRLHPGLLLMKHALASGIVGRVRWVQIEVGQYLPNWRPGTDHRRGVSANRVLGGGALRELSHELDYFLWLFGPVSAVTAKLHRATDLVVDVEDHADLLMTTPEGVRATIHLDMYQRQSTRTCKVVGEKGSITCDLLSGEVIFLGEKPRRIAPAVEIRWNDLYLDELLSFIGCVKDGRQPAVTGADGITVIQLIEASERSSQERRTIDL